MLDSQEILFNKGIDKDTAIELIESGKYLDLVNSRIISGDTNNSNFKIAGIKGNTKIEKSGNTESITLSKILNTCYDATNGDLYCIGYGVNSGYYLYSILKVNLEESTFDNIFISQHIASSGQILDTPLARGTFESELNYNDIELFDVDSTFVDCCFLDGNIFITDGISDPKCINVEKLSSDVDYYTSYDSITLINQPPMNGVESTYFTDSTKNGNQLHDKLFRFRTQYVYFDNSVSALSDVSYAGFPYDDYDLEGSPNEEVEHNNGIRVSHTFSNNRVSKIRLFSSYTLNSDIANESLWSNYYLIDTQDVSDLIYNFSFYNGAFGEVLATSESVRIYDDVPLSASSVEALDRRIAFGGNEFGVENIETIGSVTYKKVDCSYEAEINKDEIKSRYFKAPYNIKYDAIEEIQKRPKYSYFLAGEFMVIDVPETITSKIDKVSVRVSRKIYSLQTDIYISIDTSNVEYSETYSEDISAEIVSKINDEFPNRAYYEIDAFTSSGYVIPFYSDNTNPAYITLGSQYVARYCQNVDGHKQIYIRIGQIMYDDIRTNEFGGDSSESYAYGCPCKIKVYSTTGPDEEKALHYGSDLLDKNGSYTFSEGEDNYNAYEYTTFTTPLLVYNQSILKDKTNALKTFSPFSEHSVGVVYSDTYGRRSFTQKLDDLIINKSNSDYNDPQLYKLEATIEHKAPSWAKFWKLVVSEDKFASKFQELSLFAINDLESSSNPPINPFYEQENILHIRYNDIVKLWRKFYPNCGYNTYTFSEGDRIKLYIGIDGAYKFVDVPIIGLSDEGDIKVGIDYYNNRSVFIGNNVILYTPKFDSIKDSYYDCMDWQPVAGGNHSLKNGYSEISSIQSSNSPLQFTSSFGDCYLGQVNFLVSKLNQHGYTNSQTQALNIYNSFFSPLYNSSSDNLGTINVENDYALSKRYNSIIFGNEYIKDSKVNGLKTFDSSNSVNINSEFGEIVKIIKIGYVLKAITKNKIASLYIQRQVPSNPDGSTSILLTDTVLGTLSYPDNDYGSIHPYSIKKCNRSILMFDEKNSAIIRDSSNGQIDISTYGYKSEFSKISNDLTENSYLVGGFNRNTNEYILYIKSEIESYRLYFNLDFNIFSHRIVHEEIINNISTVGDIYLTSAYGDIYIEESNDTLYNFYGQQYDSFIEFVLNKNPKQIKQFQSISVYANNVWDSANNGDISTIPNSNYKEGMSSRLLHTKFKNKEGVFYSEFMRDGNTPNMTYDEGIVNGRKIRSNCLIVRLNNKILNNVFKNSELFSISTKFVYSNLTI